MNKPGRNDSCPCGSGKKYKKYCLPRDQAARPRPQAAAGDREEDFIAVIKPELDAAVDRVLERVELGAGRAVEPEIKRLLEQHPRYHSTLFAMGVYLAVVMQDPVGALPFFEKAVQIFPPFQEAHFNLGNSARKAADITKAVTAYRAAIHYSQDDDEIAKKARAELQFIEKVALKNSPFPNLDAYMANARLFDEAFACLANRDFERAVELFNRVLSENPAHVQSFGNVALAHAALGRRAIALECLERALALDPLYEPAIANRRIIARMREGEPSPPGAIHETYYYRELLNRVK